mgnify:CR=1 FL=1
MIEEHGGDADFFVGPFGVEISVGLDGFAAAESTEGGGPTGALGILQDRSEAFPVEMFGMRQVGQVAEGGIKIDEFDKGLGLSALGQAGASDNQGHAQRFVKGVLLSPEAVFAEEKSVIAPENDDGVVGEAEFGEGVDDLADLGVNIADAGVVGMAGLGLECFGGFHAASRAAVAGEFFRRDVLGWIVSGRIVVVREFDFIAVVEVPVFLRRVEGEVRTPEAAGEKEGFTRAFQPSQIVNGFGGDLAVLISLIRDVSRFAIGPAERIGIDVPCGVVVLPDAVGVVFAPVLLAVVNLGRAPEFVPIVPAVLDVVQNLAVGDRAVAVLRHPGGQRDVAEGDLVAVPDIRRRADAGDDAGPRGSAARHIAVGAVKAHAACRQFVDVWRENLSVSVATQLGAEIVHGDEQDVLFWSGLFGGEGRPACQGER